MNKAIIGAGGLGREIYVSLNRLDKISCIFFVDDYYYNNEPNTFPLSKFNPERYEVIVALGDPKARFEMVQKLPKETQYFTFIHPSAQILSKDINIGKGSFIGANCVLTTNIQLGSYSILNRNVNIGHDCSIGSYFSAMTGSVISGNVTIGEYFYMGNNSSIREKITIGDNIKIGMNAAVVKNITQPGTYVGVPVKRL
jgi:sugar O-acyltransferase (sialic acid O-acetyltransferase NeuD family)